MKRHHEPPIHRRTSLKDNIRGKNMMELIYPKKYVGNKITRTITGKTQARAIFSNFFRLAVINPYNIKEKSKMK